jgi:hypothetical protein
MAAEADVGEAAVAELQWPSEDAAVPCEAEGVVAASRWRDSPSITGQGRLSSPARLTRLW